MKLSDTQPEVDVQDSLHSASKPNIRSQQLILMAAGFGLLVLGISLFGKLAEEIHESETQSLDVAILEAIHSFSSPFLDSTFAFLTNFGGLIGISILTIILTLILLRRQRRTAALQVFVGVIGAVGLNVLAKSIFVRERPQLWERIVTENFYSFPSGHAMASSALAFTIILLCWNTRWRLFSIVLGSAYILLIGVSRLYLGVHYPSDILGGWLLSAVWVLLVALAIGVIKISKKRKA